jgi:hypothetical protein
VIDEKVKMKGKKEKNKGREEEQRKEIQKS